MRSVPSAGLSEARLQELLTTRAYTMARTRWVAEMRLRDRPDLAEGEGLGNANLTIAAVMRRQAELIEEELAKLSTPEQECPRIGQTVPAVPTQAPAAVELPVLVSLPASDEVHGVPISELLRQDPAGFLTVVGGKIEEMGGFDVTLRHAVAAAVEELLEAGIASADEGEADQFCWEEVDDIYGRALTSGLIICSYEHGTADSIDLLDFGNGMIYMVFDRNEDRGNEATIIEGIDPSDRDELSRRASEEMFIGVGATEMMLPSAIYFGEEVREEDIRGYLTLSIGVGSFEPLGIPSNANESDRVMVISAYFDLLFEGGLGGRRSLRSALPRCGPERPSRIRSNWPSPRAGPSEPGRDAGMGALLSDLLDFDGDSIAADLDRIETELKRLRSELGDSEGS